MTRAVFDLTTLEYIEPLTEEEQQAARLVVCDRLEDAEQARTVLDALGLLP